MRIYQFCPFDGEKLIRKEIGGKERSACQKCGYVNFENAHAGAGVLIENNKGEILLCRRNREPKKGKWDIPGGFMEGDELPEIAAIREAKEETGLDIKIVKLIKVGLGTYDDPKQGFFYTLNFGYLAKIVGGKLKPDAEVYGLKFFPKDQLPQVAFDGDRQIIEAYQREIT